MAAAAVAISLPALASAESLHASGISGTFDLRFGTWLPSIDSESSFGSKGPYETSFGGDSMFYFEGLSGHELYRGIGSAGVEFGLGWGGVSGKSSNADGQKTTDETNLRILPVRLGAFYRFDWLQTRFNVPLVFAVDAGYANILWWANATDGVADWANASGTTFTGRGSTAGTYYGGTVYFLLDALAPSMAANFDGNSGVNNSYLFASYVSTQADDFGDKKSWDLSDDTALFGIGFEY